MSLLSDLTFMRYGLPGPLVHAVDDYLVPVAGAQLRVRIYRPTVQPHLPAHIYLHGGGWKLGSIDERVVDATCRQRCVEAHCAVLSVDYRLAPEHPFPVALDDCYAVLGWAHLNADVLDLDADNVSVGGSSAGGNLAAALALRTRNEGGPPLRFQLLEVPALDL